MKTKTIVILLTLALCVGVFVLPQTALAATATDSTPPTLTVKLDGEKLHIEAKDDISGVEAIYIDGHRVNTLVNGVADVALKDYAGNGKQVGVYAVDYAGNRSEVTLLDNPYYKKPAATSSAPAASPTPAATPEPTVEPEETESVIPSGTNSFTPDGAGTVTDNATDADGKEFYTITSVDGNVFYLVIDKQRDSDNVYFLNAVTETDLMALAQKESDDGQSAIPTPQPEATPQPAEASPQPMPTPEPEVQGGIGAGTIIFILLAMAAVGGAGYYFKIVKPRKQAAIDDMEDDYEDENTDGDYDQYSDDAEYEDTLSDDEDSMGGAEDSE